MRRRRILLLLAGCALVAFVLILLWPCEREPSYQGKSLSEWLFLYVAQNGQDTPQAASATVAVQGIGTNALPFLLEWAAYEPSEWKRKLTKIEAQLPRPLDQGYWAEARRWNLSEYGTGFKILGPAAKPAIQELSRMVNQQKSEAISRRAIRALTYIGKDGVPDLMTALADQDQNKRYYAAGYIGGMASHDTNLSPLVPLLAKCTEDIVTAEPAVKALGNLAVEPAVALPVLTDALLSQKYWIRVAAADALINFGEEARLAIPKLKARLDDDELVVRQAATNALLKISPESLTNAAPPSASEQK